MKNELNNCDNPYPYYPYYPQPFEFPYNNNYMWGINSEPTKCTEKVHVFPCDHCKKCECGKLTLPKDK